MKLILLFLITTSTNATICINSVKKLILVKNYQLNRELDNFISTKFNLFHIIDSNKMSQRIFGTNNEYYELNNKFKLFFKSISINLDGHSKEQFIKKIKKINIKGLNLLQKDLYILTLFSLGDKDTFVKIISNIENNEDYNLLFSRFIPIWSKYFNKDSKDSLLKIIISNYYSYSKEGYEIPNKRLADYLIKYLNDENLQIKMDKDSGIRLLYNHIKRMSYLLESPNPISIDQVNLIIKSNIKAFSKLVHNTDSDKRVYIVGSLLSGSSNISNTDLDIILSGAIRNIEVINYKKEIKNNLKNTSLKHLPIQVLYSYKAEFFMKMKTSIVVMEYNHSKKIIYTKLIIEHNDIINNNMIKVYGEYILTETKF